jgi:hypothetical protein
MKDICYPPHAICWTLIEGLYGRNFLEHGIRVLFAVYESSYYSQRARALTRDYSFDSMNNRLFTGPEYNTPGRQREDLIAINKD